MASFYVQLDRTLQNLQMLAGEVITALAATNCPALHHAASKLGTNEQEPAACCSGVY